jgi:DivIVA domain-containing protein
MQNLTPLEIQKAVFSRKFKGYNVDEVRGYLYLVAEEIERVLKQNDELIARERHAPRRPRGAHPARAHPQGHAPLRADAFRKK